MCTKEENNERSMDDTVHGVAAIDIAYRRIQSRFKSIVNFSSQKISYSFRLAVFFPVKFGLMEKSTI